MADPAEYGQLRPVREITAEEENFRIQPTFVVGQHTIGGIKRDGVEPEPVGTYVVMVFRVTGYDPDCDGSLMARLEQVDRHGQTTGWEPTHLGLYPDTDLVVDDPETLWRLSERSDNHG